jgi:hypothetical protein
VPLARICAGGGLSVGKGRPYRDPHPVNHTARDDGTLETTIAGSSQQYCFRSNDRRHSASFPGAMPAT